MSGEVKRIMRQAADLQRSLDVKDVMAFAELLDIKSESCKQNGRTESAGAYSKVAGQLRRVAKDFARTQGREKA